MVNKEDFLEAEIAVDKINDELFEKYGDNMPIVSITKAYCYLLINVSLPDLPEIGIYLSENDERIFYEKSNKYESFYKFIKRKFREIKSEINKYKL